MSTCYFLISHIYGIWRAHGNSDSFFGDFMDAIEPLIEGAPTRVLLDLVHAWSK